MTQMDTDIRSQQRFLETSSMKKLGVFVALTAVIAIGTYFGAQPFLLGDDTVDDNRRLVKIARGTLLDDVTASGSVAFPVLESLRFDTSGTVAEILVVEGEFVVEGQSLILLDDVTIAALESAVANARRVDRDLAEQTYDRSLVPRRGL